MALLLTSAFSVAGSALSPSSAQAATLTVDQCNAQVLLAAATSVLLRRRLREGAGLLRR